MAIGVLITLTVLLLHVFNQIVSSWSMGIGSSTIEILRSLLLLLHRPSRSKNIWMLQHLEQGCTTCTPDAARTLLYLPSEQIKKYQTLLVNYDNFMNEFKLHWTINNFATYYNPKQLSWQQYQTTSNKKASWINFIFSCHTWLSKVQIVILSLTLECTGNNKLQQFAKRGCAPPEHIMNAWTDKVLWPLPFVMSQNWQKLVQEFRTSCHLSILVRNLFVGYTLLGDATSTTLPYLTVLPLSIGFQKGGGTCVSERCGFCYQTDRWFVSRLCFWLLLAGCRCFGSVGLLRR